MRKKLFQIFIFLVIGIVFLLLQPKTIVGGDAGDLLSAVITHGIPHPPGYPLYTSLSILFSNIIPSGTIAWRVSFISVFSSLITLIFIYKILQLLKINFLVSLISILYLGFLYPYLLYSVTTEVFALNNMFLALLFYLALKFHIFGNIKSLYLLSYFLGLSLTHHHTILFLLPSLVLLIKKKALCRLRIVITSATFFIIGLIPYFYVVISSYFNPQVNWQGYPTFQNVFNLVTRANYGSFMAGGFVGHDPKLRLIGLWALWDFFLTDFRLIGLLFMLIGIWKMRKMGWIFTSWMVAISSYIFFIFYASFPLVDRFMLGTFERFVLPVYIFSIIVLAIGLEQITKIVTDLFNRLISYRSHDKESLMVIVRSVFFVLPVGILLTNVPRIIPLKNDFTAEELGRDILKSTEGKGLLMLSIDTSLFNTQYVYYSDRTYPNLNLIHYYKLMTDYYSYQLKAYNPDVFYPENIDDPFFIHKFITENDKRMPVFSKQSFPSVNGERWYPWGLVFRYFSKDSLPGKEYVMKKNEQLWRTFQDPMSGALANYQNLMHSDILRVYSIGRQEIAFWEMENGYLEQALNHISYARKLTPEDIDTVQIMGKIYMKLNRCSDAETAINEAIRLNKDLPTNYQILFQIYDICFKDSLKAGDAKKTYDILLKREQTPIKKL